MRKDLDVYVAAMWASLAPLHPVFAMLVALPTIDLILGCMVSWRNGIKPHSLGIGRTIGKVTLYIASVLLAFATERWLTGTNLGIQTFMTTVIGARELKSCLEHLDELHGGSLLRTATDFLVAAKRRDNDNGDPKL